MQTDPPLDAIVIGGGITGLSAAWFIQQANPALRYALLEGDRRWGGKLVSAHLPTPDGQSCLADGGAESFVTRKPEVWALAKALNVPTCVPLSETSGMYVLYARRIHAIPLNPFAFITSQLLTPRGKLRMLAEPFMPPRRDVEDESLADYVRRRLGNEALEKMLGPVLSGIYNSNPEQQSILVSAPIMREMERAHGSLFKAVVARLRAARKNKDAPKKPRFITFEGGAAALVTALVQRLTGDLRLQASAVALWQAEGLYHVQLANGEVLRAKALLVTILANTAAQLLATLAPEAAAALAQIRHSSIGTASLVFRTADLPAKQPIRGLMIPRREKRPLDAVQWTSARMPERAPEGYSLLRVFFGGSQPEMVARDDESLRAVIQSELADLFGITAAPLAFRAFRWQDGYPLADVNHLNLVAKIESALPAGLFLAGSAYRGVGVPDCIRQAQQAAQTLSAWCAEHSLITL